MPVLDASVCVAFFRQDEPGHQTARAWLTAAADHEESLVAPVILLAEVASALGRAMPESQPVTAVIELLRSRTLVQLFAVDEKLAARAAIIAATHRIRGSDAIYVALADQLAIPLVTFDRQQLERGGLVVTAHTPAP